MRAQIVLEIRDFDDAAGLLAIHELLQLHGGAPRQQGSYNLERLPDFIEWVLEAAAAGWFDSEEEDGLPVLYGVQFAEGPAEQMRRLLKGLPRPEKEGDRSEAE